MRKHIIAAAVLSALSFPALAQQSPITVPQDWQVKEKLALKDGTILNVYRDGKMAMQNKTGFSVNMTPGETMETKDGRKVAMVGDERLRVDVLNTSPNSLEP